jgi:hypothetical protein
MKFTCNKYTLISKRGEIEKYSHKLILENTPLGNIPMDFSNNVGRIQVIPSEIYKQRQLNEKSLKDGKLIEIVTEFKFKD